MLFLRGICPSTETVLFSTLNFGAVSDGNTETVLFNTFNFSDVFEGICPSTETVSTLNFDAVSK